MKLKNVGSNMTELFDNLTGATIFFSYETPVCAILPSGRVVKTNEYYSRTTTKHINKWLGDYRLNVEEVSQSFINNLANF
jgi:hypothetical protein